MTFSYNNRKIHISMITCLYVMNECILELYFQSYGFYNFKDFFPDFFELNLILND